jgi:PAS domain S-box-containing protein
MLKQKQNHDPGVLEGRKLGKDMKERGVFEVDTSSGSIEWVNEFALKIMGCTEEQLASMSVFDVSPERFHDQIREDLTEEDPEKTRRHIFPTKTVEGKVAWWYVFKVRTSDSRRWAYADHIQDTPQSGPEFSFMSMQVDMANSQADLEGRIGDLEKWVGDQIARVDRDMWAVQKSLEKAEQAALAASADAIAAKNASLATQQEIRKYATKEDMQSHFEKFDAFEEQSSEATTEILRLIRADIVHEERLKTYENHVKKTTETAVKAIELQASKSGKGLSRKVTVPIFVVTTLAMVFQYILQHWNVHILP